MIDKVLSLLLLEDSPDDAKIIERELRKGTVPFRLTVVDSERNFRTALEKAEIDLVLSDYNLPGFSGFAALAICRQQCPDVPFIFVSGVLGEEQAIETLKQGATDYVLKTGLSRLVPAIERAMIEVDVLNEKRRAEQLLIEREKKYRTLVTEINDGVFIVDNDGVLLYANESLSSMFGYDSPDEMIGMHYSNLMHPEDVGNASALSYRFQKEGFLPERLEIRGVQRDGGMCYVEVKPVVIRNGGTVGGARGVIRDMTERRLAEETIRSQKNELELSNKVLNTAFKELESSSEELMRRNEELVAAQNALIEKNAQIQADEQRLKEAQELGRMGSWEFDVESGGIIWSEQVFKLYERDMALGPPTVEEEQSYYTPEDAATLREYAGLAIQNRAEYSHDFQVFLPGGKRKWFTATITPVNDAAGTVRKLKGVVHDITDRKIAERRQALAVAILNTLNELKEKRETMREIILMLKRHIGVEAVGLRLHEDHDYPYFETNGFPDDFIEQERFLCARDESGSAVLDAGGSPVLECMCGVVISGGSDPSKPFFTPGGSFWTNSMDGIMTHTNEDGRLSRLRSRCKDEGYESVALVPLRSKTRIIGLLQFNDRRKNQFTPDLISFLEGIGASIGIALDRYEAEEHIKRALEEKEVMLKEIHHRVKNNLQLVSSMLGLQARYIRDARDVELFNDSCNRIRSMALIHEKLYMSEDLSRIDFSEFINALTDELARSYNIVSGRYKVSIDVRNIFLNINKAIPVGLIINELLSNAMKHAFPDDKSGTIFVELKKEDDSYLLTVSDDGIGLPEDFQFPGTTTLGLTLVDTFVKQLNGGIDIVRDSGLTYIIRFAG
ncbi:MAG: hypothetical protein A2176_07670 [Spirochaetes bacterium RBG_13_51_14]|nr:MAG: hypothetical protein A2176_07670 [Spirochaetes bacterium RBG_13_51_14]